MFTKYTRKPKAVKKPRYTSDTLIYESFYVALRNSLVVALAPVIVFLFLAAVEDYPMNLPFLRSIATVTEMAFIVSFFVNFLYYVYFIKVRKTVSCALVLFISCGLAFTIFLSDLKNMLSDEYQAVIVAIWFVLLAVIIIVNKMGRWPNDDSRYDQESWLYRHELAEGREDEDDEIDPEDKYTHSYILEEPEDEYDDEEDEENESNPVNY